MAVAVGLLFAVVIFVSNFQGPVNAYEVLGSHKESTRPNVHDTKECWFEEQRLDHFTYKPEDARWRQRYLMYQHYWKDKRKTGPIFFYGTLRSMHDKQPEA